MVADDIGVSGTYFRKPFFWAAMQRRLARMTRRGAFFRNCWTDPLRAWTAERV